MVRLGDGFEDSAYRRARLRVNNYMAYHLAELQYLRNKKAQEQHKAVAIDHNDGDAAKRCTKLLREALETGELPDLLGSTYMERETCTWVDWVFADGTKKEVQKQKSLAFQEFQKLKGCSPPEWHEQMNDKYR